MKEVVVEVMRTYKAAKLFQIMVIMNLNLGNLTLEVNTLKKKMAMGEKEKVVL